MKNLRLLVRWYLAPSTLPYVAALVVVVVLVLTDLTVPAAMIALALAGIWIPYKLARLDSSRTSMSTRLTRTAEDVERVRVDWERASDDRQRYLAAVESVRAEQVDLLRAERRSWQSEIARLDGTSSKGLEELGDRLAARLDSLQDRFEAQLLAQGRRFSLELARRDPLNDGAPETLVILTPQRSGSTWLFDLLRTNPFVVVRPAADRFASLGAVGNRYPADLTNGNGDQISIELQVGVGGTIPRLPIAGASAAFGAAERYALEKVHPSAVGFDAEGFVRAVAAEGRTTLVHLVRRPTETILSFLAYQQRSPTWHSATPKEGVIAHCLRSLEFIEHVHDRVGGLVVAYEQLVDTPIETLAEIFTALGIAGSPTDAARYAAHAFQVCSTERKGKGLFTGEKDRSQREALLLGQGFGDPEAALRMLERCDELYDGIVSRRGPGGDSVSPA